MLDKKVNYQFKVLYALGIIFVVAGHSGGNGGMDFWTNWFPLYSFHLGIFVFASGYFYSEQAENTIPQYIWKKIKRMVIPLYIWNVFYGVFVLISKTQGFTIGGDFTLRNLLLTPVLTGHQFIYNLGGWFIIPLIGIEAFHVLFRKFLGKWLDTRGVFAIYLIMGIVGIYISSKGYRNGWYLVFCRMLIFLPFYAAGNFYKNVLEKKDMQKNIYYFGFIFAVQLVMITVIGYPPYYDWAFCSNFVNGPIVPYILGFTGIAFWLRIARILTPLLKDNQLMLMIANNTYSIMLHHLLGIMFVKTVFAAISKFTGYCQDFDWLKYKSDLWWPYWPKGLAQWGLIYLVAGIAVGLILGVAEKKIAKKTTMFLTNKRLTGYVNRNT